MNDPTELECARADVVFDPYNQPFFKQSEFVRAQATGARSIDWLPQIDVNLLIALNILRTEVGHPIMISPAAGSIGRPNGRKASDHYCNSVEGIKVRALDVMPYTIAHHTKRPLNREQAFRFAMTAVASGINAIGIYPQWKPFAGFHLGVREQTNVSTWGRVSDRYTSFIDGLDTWGIS